ncbi:MAG: DsrE family protein [Candidatus Thiodiazotropha sp. (ex Ustalcina ferruginea)]|nr:DsrE family protein [Candidatus Thiodiazotropha sp. (ex Ustalcina ferruginea)]
MDLLIILNDPPYGTERSYNGLRLAKALIQKESKITVFLMADAVACAKHGQKVPQGFYNMELMLNAIIRKGEVLLCGTCMNARGITDEDIAVGAQRSTVQELAERTLAADKVLVF